MSNHKIMVMNGKEVYCASLFLNAKTGCAHPDAPCKNPHTISKAGSSPSGTSCFSLPEIWACSACHRQVLFVLPRCSSRQGWPGRMPVPDGQWLHRGKGKCLWTFSFCSNARSFDCPTVAKSGEKIKVPIFIRRKGADDFRPALAAGGSLMA